MMSICSCSRSYSCSFSADCVFVCGLGGGAGGLFLTAKNVRTRVAGRCIEDDFRVIPREATAHFTLLFFVFVFILLQGITFYSIIEEFNILQYVPSTFV